MNMQFQHSHLLKPYWDLVLASVQADALASVLDIGLLDALVEKFDAEALSSRFNLDLNNLKHILDLLCGMGIIEKTQVHSGKNINFLYQTTLGARRYFARCSSDYCGDAWRFRLRSFRDLGNKLPEYLKFSAEGERKAKLEAADQCWATIARTKIVQEQAAITVEASLSIIDRVPDIKGFRNFLDIGCGAGMFAIALAKAFPECRGVAFDLPPMVEVARQNIEAAGIGRRLSVHGGDLSRDEIGHGYDLIWCSSVLHFVPDLPGTLRKIRSALAPRGVLVSIHAEIPFVDQQIGPVLAYYLPLLMRGHYVGRQGELAEALLAAGFESVAAFDSTLFPFSPVQVQVCR